MVVVVDLRCCTKEVMRMSILLAALLVPLLINAATLTNVIVVPGSAQDGTALNGTPAAANVNRLGGFGSDLFYDRPAGVFYGLTDRGPGGGGISYPPSAMVVS